MSAQEKRAALLQELANVREEQGGLQVRRVALERRVPSLERVLEAKRADKARGLVGAGEVDQAHQELAGAQGALREARAEFEAVVVAGQHVEAELAQLFETELSAFLPDAEALTQAAADALSAAEPALREAEAAWARAVGAWSPLLPAIRAAAEQTDREAGVMRGASTLVQQTIPPAFPASTVFDLFDAIRAGHLTPRPAALTPPDTPRDADVISLDLRTHA